MLHSNKGTSVTYQQKTFAPEDLQILKNKVIGFCDKKIAHPDKRADQLPLTNLRSIADNLNPEPQACALELHRLLAAVHEFIETVNSDNQTRRSSYQEIQDFLQTTCAQIAECEFADDTAVRYAIENLKEHLDYTDDAIQQRKKWGLLHASELTTSQNFFYYWLDATLEILRAIQKGDPKLCLSTYYLTRYIDGLFTGCEIINTKQSPENPETLAKLQLHFDSVFIRHEKRLFYYKKSKNQLTEITIPNQHALDSLDQDISSTVYTLPITRAMLQEIRNITGFNGHTTCLAESDRQTGMSYFTPRNILIALLDGVFFAFNQRSEDANSQNNFQADLEKILSTILVRRIAESEHMHDVTQHNDERNTLEYIVDKIAELTGDTSYPFQLPTKQAVQPLMELAKATSKTELQAMLATCRLVPGNHGMEADRKQIEAIINHAPSSLTDSSETSSALQVFSRKLTYADKLEIKRQRGATPVQSRDISDTASINATLSGRTSPRKKAAEVAAPQAVHLYPHERWKPWQRVLVAVGVGLLVSGIFLGIAAALLYAGPVAHVLLATGIAATVHWAVTVGTVGVVGTLVGLPVVGMAIGLIAGLIWNRKTERELKILNVVSAAPEAHVAVSPSSLRSSGRGLSFGLMNSVKQTNGDEQEQLAEKNIHSPRL